MPQQTIKALVAHIVERANEGDEQLIALAKIVRELKQRVEAGEAGAGIKWMEWALKNIKLKSTRLYELNAIANADDPKKELDDLRRANRERQKERRERLKNGGEVDPERAEVIKLIRTVKIEVVHEVRALIRQHINR